MKLKTFILFTAVLLMTVPGISGQSEINESQNTATGGFTGTVAEAMDAKGYTYVLVDDGIEKRWAAAPEFKIRVGDRVTVPPCSEMRDFYSKTLNRKFESILFAAWMLLLRPEGWAVLSSMICLCLILYLFETRPEWLIVALGNTFILAWSHHEDLLRKPALKIIPC